MTEISVVIATYNAAETISKALDSILSQTCSDVDVLVIDACSTDNTIAIVKSYPTLSIRCVVEEDDGIYDAMNKGVLLAEGNWVFFMGADDIFYDKNVLQNMLGKDSEVAQYDVVIGNIQFDNSKIRRSSISPKTKFINTVHHQSVFYRRALFSNFKYNSAYKVSADYELNLFVYMECLRVLEKDIIVCLVGLAGASAQVDFCGYSEEIKIRNKYLKPGPLRILANAVTRMRYVVKKLSRLLGYDLQYCN